MRFLLLLLFWSLRRWLRKSLRRPGLLLLRLLLLLQFAQQLLGSFCRRLPVLVLVLRRLLYRLLTFIYRCPLIISGRFVGLQTSNAIVPALSERSGM